MNNEIILHRIEDSETDYICDITSLIDKHIVHPKDSRCRSYLDDPEFYMRRNTDGKFIRCILEETFYDDTAVIPIVFDSTTRGHVLVNTDQIVCDVVLYNNTNDISVIMHVLSEVKGRKIVIEN